MAEKVLEVPVYILLFLGLLTSTVKGDPDMTIGDYACNQATYNEGDPYMFSLKYVLWDLLNNIPQYKGYNRYTQSPHHGPVCYGHAQCSTALNPDECADCMTKLQDQLSALCHNSVGAQLVFQYCRIRYENYPFI